MKNVKITDFQIWEPHKFNEGGFKLKWTSDSGFGEFSFFKKKGKDKWICDNEMMDKESVKSVLLKFLDEVDFKYK